MKIILISAGIIVLAVPLAVWIFGTLLPANHVAKGSRTIGAAHLKAAHWIRDIQSQPAWRKDVKEIVVIDRVPALRYREISAHGKIQFVFREISRDTQFESVIDDASQPFGGRWLITLENAMPHTVVTIREEGEVRSPLFRFFSKYVFGHDKTLNQYLDDLAAHAKQEALVNA